MMNYYNSLRRGRYTRLKNGEGKGEALRNAQLNIMRNPARVHPYFWASFIEIGDWRPLNQSVLRGN